MKRLQFFAANSASCHARFRVSPTTRASRYGFGFASALLTFLTNFAVLVGTAHAQSFAGVEVQINATGASNTKCDAIPNVVCYWKQAEPLLREKSIVVNSAVNGSTASEFNVHFAERVQPYNNKRFSYNILALQTGGNDILANASAETTFGNLKAITRKWKALGSGNLAVVATVPRFGYSPSQLPEADKLNRLILSEDTFDATFDIGGIRELSSGLGCPANDLSPDCSHLSTAGNRLVAPLFAAAINSALSSSRSHRRDTSSGLAK